MVIATLASRNLNNNHIPTHNLSHSNGRMHSPCASHRGSSFSIKKEGLSIEEAMAMVVAMACDVAMSMSMPIARARAMARSTAMVTSNPSIEKSEAPSL